MGLSARISTTLVASLTAPLDLTTALAPIDLSFSQNWKDGSGAGQANKIWTDRRTVAGGATDSIDLAGVLAGLLGGTLTFTALKEIIIAADDGNAGNLRVGKAISNVFVGPFGANAIGNLIEPGGLFHQRTKSAGGWAVTGGTGDILPIENLAGSGNANYDIVLIGI